jgi:hypothetical protein
LVLAAAVFAACSQLEKPTRPCASADDCLAPLVCCTEGFYLSLNGFSGPTCGPRFECPGAFLPFLPEGAPCARAPEVAGETCKAGLSCCPSTLTCETAATCATATAPTSVDPPAEVTCSADVDCDEGRVCCGIDYQDRAGTCRGVAACAAAQGIAVPGPDAGVGDGGGGADGGVGNAAELCARAFCGEGGPRSPSAQERAVCLSVAQGGGFLPTQACIDALDATRVFCDVAFRPRVEVASDALPIVPAACRPDAPAPDALARGACATLSRCRKLGGMSVEACAIQVAGLGYDALSRIADVAEDCRFTPAARFGVAPTPGPASRCRVDADCPARYSCQAQQGSRGVCVRACSSDNDCGVGGRCLQRNCYATCPPLEDMRREVIEAACGGRVDLDGPSELACLPTVAGGGAVVGACVAVPAAGACGVDLDPVRPAPNARSAYGYTCSTSTVGLPRLSPCQASPTADPCAGSVCMPSFGSLCTTPCVASPFASASACPAGELCVPPDRGWGIVGACLPRCTDAPCPAGLTCRTFGASRACAP